MMFSGEGRTENRMVALASASDLVVFSLPQTTHVIKRRRFRSS